MFNDERINAECGKIYSKGILFAVYDYRRFVGELICAVPYCCFVGTRFA